MRFKLLAYMLFVPLSVIAQEQVETTGIGVADTKVKACEIALDNARREAAQSATAIVSSKYESTETDKGINHRQDQISTTKAFAKLIDKKESFTLDGESGLIKCDVMANFKAGFVNVESTDQIGSSTTETKAVAFTSGEPFCSKILKACFREYYSKELDVFGIQYLSGRHHYILRLTKEKARYYGAGTKFSSNYSGWITQDLYLITEVSGEEVSSKSAFIRAIKGVHTGGIHIKGFYNGHYWGKRGYSRHASNSGFESYTHFPNTSELSEAKLSKIDDTMRKVLDEAAEF
jgi:hypothetical protein